MHHFQYRGDELYCEDVPLAKIAAEVGTPTYVYSQATLERHYRVFDEALASVPHLVCYSVKANSNLAVLRTLIRLGAGVDTVSGGEIFRALRAGVDPQKIVFSGVGKRVDEMQYALEQNILAFNVESLDELDVLDAVAGKLGKRARVSLRINPDVDAETHPYISTGLKKNKFGIAYSHVREAFARALKLPNLDPVGLDFHIGSQLTKTTPFRDAILRLGELAKSLVADGVPLKYLDIGGGLGIPYNEEEPPSPTEYGAEVVAAMETFRTLGLDLTLICEPGRVIVGNAGVLLTRTIFNKRGEMKSFVIVDAAMNDLIRPAFYDSYHGIRPVVRRAQAKPFVADVVGPICETGDFLARDRELSQRPEANDLLAIMSAGAYGFTMSSNYNTRPRAAEVLVDGDTVHVIRDRETLEHLLKGERPLP